MSKFEEFFAIQFSNIPIDSILQCAFRRFSGNVRTLDLLISSLLSFLSFNVTLFCYHKNNAYTSLLVITLLW